MFGPATIHENYMAGGMVPADHVGDLLDTLLDSSSAIVAALVGEGLDEVGAYNVVFKFIESCLLARSTGAHLVEATEIYSGFAGRMN